MDWGDPALTSFVADSSFRHLCCYGAGIAGQYLSLATQPTFYLFFLLPLLALGPGFQTFAAEFDC
jgi:hypothetical protein